MSRVLVVDDDTDIVKLLAAKFRKEGWEVSVAGDGVSCISTALRVEPDLIVLDIQMPAGDGFKTLERIQSNIRLASVPVVVYSGQDASGAEGPALAAGATAYVTKTGRVDELLWTVNRVLDGDWPAEA